MQLSIEDPYAISGYALPHSIKPPHQEQIRNELDDKIKRVQVIILSTSGEDKYKKQTTKQYSFFDRTVTVKIEGKGNISYADMNIASCAKSLGISKQTVFNLAKNSETLSGFYNQLAQMKFNELQRQYEVKTNMGKINKVAPQFTEADLLATMSFLDKNKESLMADMENKKNETIYIRPSKKNGLARVLQINRNGDVFIHFNKAKQNDLIIGKGSFKKVKYALNLKDSQLIAVARLSVTKPDDKRMGENEAGTLKKFDKQPGFAQLSQLADVEGKGGKNKLLFLQPIYNKGDLAKAKQSLTIDQKKSIAIQMLEACAQLGKETIIHRDIKLDNFLVNEANGEFKIFLSDFGSSTVFTGDQISEPAGTSPAMSPEYRLAIIKRDEEAIGRATTEKLDAWALGAALFEMFTDKQLNYSSSSQDSFDEQFGPLDAALNDASDTVFKHLVRSLLKVDPNERLSAQKALHQFKEESTSPKINNS